jgi:outer membrane protein assembly factor BamD
MNRSLFFKKCATSILSFSLTLTLTLTYSLLMSACSTESVQNTTAPQQLLNEAVDDASAGRFQIAADKLRNIRNQYPNAPEAVSAQLKLADVYYDQESYLEAANAYQAFRDLHPKHAQSDYALFRQASAHMKDAPSNPARDLNSTAMAQNELREYISRFPKGNNIAEAQSSLKIVRNKLAEKELIIAKFYLKQGNKEAAKIRLDNIKKYYYDTDLIEQVKQYE